MSKSKRRSAKRLRTLEENILMYENLGGGLTKQDRRHLKRIHQQQNREIHIKKAKRGRGRIQMGDAQAKHCNRHHLINACRGGTWDRWNISVLDIDFHNWWHKRFQNKSLHEVIEFLQRWEQIKESQKPTQDEKEI